MSPRLTTLTLRSPRRAAEARSQECAVAATAHMDRVPESADFYWTDLRRGRRRVYGGLLAFIDRARSIGAPLSVVLFGVRVVWAYAHECYGVEPTPLGTFGAPLPRGV
jgi:hypothetical protein